ncbi:hypothetical protein HDZ31DRAFT_28601 [Schizophyllum fasciatum]
MQSSADQSWDSSGLHWGLRGESILLSSLRLDSALGCFAASLLTATICLAERLTTYAHETHWGPAWSERSRWRKALWRSGLYWLASLLRLFYMLIAMSFNVGTHGVHQSSPLSLLCQVTTLATAHFFTELQKCTQTESQTEYEDAEEPLLERNPAPIALGSVPQPRAATRPRSKSKPGDIFIHPRYNNIARADAAAMELGLGGNTDRVSDASHRHADAPWKHGQGKQQARALLGHTRTRDHHAFGLDDDSDASELSSPS